MKEVIDQPGQRLLPIIEKQLELSSDEIFSILHLLFFQIYGPRPGFPYYTLTIPPPHQER